MALGFISRNCRWVPQPDVQRLLASTETNRKTDIRDRPILLLLAVYGLRVGEVQRLRLEDVNWEKKTLTITATKQRSRLPTHSRIGGCYLPVHS